MKRNLFFLLMATLLMTTAFATSGFAYPATGDDFTIVSQMDGGSGGRFLVEYGDSGKQYQTFCVEQDEYIVIGNTYEVQSLSTSVSPYTAYLYKEFLAGSYDTPNYLPMQEAIWYFENGNSSTVSPGAQEYSKDWYINQAITNNSSESLYGVRAAVLVDYSGRAAQDQLARVNEPVKLLLLGIGLIGIAGFGRRKKFY